jgi:hypothetical protein
MDDAAGSATLEPLICISCGRPLGNSGDDQPEWPTGPMCADCYQARQMDDEIWWSEANDTTDEG